MGIAAEQELIAKLYSITDINKACLSEFQSHWKCLSNNNMELWHCRAEEKPFNACVFDKLVRYPALVVGGGEGFRVVGKVLTVSTEASEGHSRYAQGTDTDRKSVV